MKSKTVIVLLVLFAIAVLYAGSGNTQERDLIWTECLSDINMSDNSVTTGMATWYLAGDGPRLPSQFPWLANFKYVTVTSFSNNIGNVLVNRYQNGRQICTDFFGPGGGFAEYSLCDSVEIVKYVAADTVTYKLCR